MRQRFLLLHNPVAGLRRARLVNQVVREMERRGAETVRLRLWGLGRNLSSEALGSILRFDGFDAVIAAGGDGTVRAIARAMGGDPVVPIGVIPAGTGNVLARELPLPTRPAEIAETLLNGPIIDIPAARAGDDPFFLMAGVGFDGDIIAGLNMELKRRIGKPAYVWPTLKSVSRPPPLFSVTIDGAAHHATWLVVAKASRYAGGFVIARDVSVLREKLVAVLFQARTRRGRIGEMLALAAGRLDTHPGVIIRPCSEVVVDAPGLAVQIDGDEAGQSPVRIGQSESRLRLIVPGSLKR